jgi:hypothetical protein
MNQLQKYVERRSEDSKSRRIAYALGSDRLPEPTPGFEWQALPFQAGDELNKNSGLQKVFQAAMATGCATVKIGR